MPRSTSSLEPKMTGLETANVASGVRMCNRRRGRSMTVFLPVVVRLLAALSPSSPLPEASFDSTAPIVEARAVPTAPRHVLELSYTETLFRGRDDLASPVAYQGLVSAGSLSYEHRGEKGWHSAYVSVALCHGLRRVLRAR